MSIQARAPATTTTTPSAPVAMSARRAPTIRQFSFDEEPELCEAAASTVGEVGGARRIHM